MPEADGFTWTFRGHELRPGSSLYSILDTRLGNIVRSTLVVDAAQAKHFGEYICTVKNELGSTSTIIALNEIGNYSYCLSGRVGIWHSTKISLQVISKSLTLKYGIFNSRKAAVFKLRKSVSIIFFVQNNCYDY